MLAQKMSFEALVAALPACRRLDVKTEPIDLGLPRYAEDNPSGYIGPGLTLHTASSPRPNCSVVIVSAAGAVGKSALAAEVSRRCSAPLWDLARSRTVASNSLVGALTSSFGAGQLGAVLADLGNGRLFVVIDALDEARLKVNEASFLDFLADLAGAAAGRPHVGFVLLGRTQIAETAWLELEGRGVSTTLYSVDYFTRPEALRYVDMRMEVTPARRAAAAHRAEFEAARNEVFALLEEAVQPTASTDANTPAPTDFVGYAPVLDAVAELLADERDFHNLRESLRADEAAGGLALRSTRLLRRVVESILDREHRNKLVFNLKPVLAAVPGWDGWDRVYDRGEQVLRLNGLLSASPPSVEAAVPPALRAGYEAAIESFLPDHPLLIDGRRPANQVFEAYLLAAALRGDDSGLRGWAAATLSNPERLPVRLLADFYLSAPGGTQSVPLSHIGLLYDSLLAAESDGWRLGLEVQSDAPTADEVPPVEAVFEWFRTPRTEEDRPVEMALTSAVNPGDDLSFGTVLRRARIDLAGPVRLGTSGREFDLGPDVELRCDRLDLACQTLVVRSGDSAEDSGSVLRADRCDGSLAGRPTVHGVLSVAWPGDSAYPWTGYAATALHPELNSGVLAGVYRRFRRIVMTLRSHSKGSLARFRPKVEHPRTLQGPVGVALLARLVGDGVMYVDGKFYHWGPDAASRHVGTSWQDLRQGTASPKLVSYLQRFVTDHPGLFAR